MSHSKLGTQGFSLVELLVVIALIGVIFTSFATFFMNYLNLYSKYQKDSSSFAELATQSQRVSQVMRGLSDIVSASANDIVAYAYFSPVDTYTSQVHYYLADNNTKLLVDVTPMTADPPIGTPITSKMKTYTVISDYYKATGVDLFSYYDASGTLMTFPITDQHSILNIQVNLAEQGSKTKNGQTLSVNVSLRNRKTNL